MSNIDEDGRHYSLRVANEAPLEDPFANNDLSNILHSQSPSNSNSSGTNQSNATHQQLNTQPSIDDDLSLATERSFTQEFRDFLDDPPRPPTQQTQPSSASTSSLGSLSTSARVTTHSHRLEALESTMEQLNA